jgi:hypothetical protein
MTLIEIADLTTADRKSFTGADSFLNELEKTETTQIFGGWRGGGWSEKAHSDRWKKDDCSYKKPEKRDHSYYYEEKCDYKYNNSWKKKC